VEASLAAARETLTRVLAAAGLEVEPEAAE
jgi:hypothetical protein